MYSMEYLEKAKDAVGFDSCVSHIIANKVGQGATVKIERLTAEVKTRFNEGKMNEVAGKVHLSKSLPRSGRQIKFVTYKTHDELDAITRKVMQEYFRLTNHSHVSRKQIREGAAKMQVALGKAVSSIPLSKVRTPRPNDN
jgi:hypothetical protein